MKKAQLVSIVGVPLAGKTTLGRGLSRELGYYFQDTDELRVKVFGWRNQPEPDPSIVDLTPLAEKNKVERHATSQMLLAMVESFLEDGESIIIAARSIGRPQNVSYLQKIAERTGADLKVIRCMPVDVSRQEIEKRLATRKPGKGFDVSVFVTYEQWLWILKQRWDEEQGEQPYPHILVDTMRDPEKCLAEALKYIRSE